MSLALKLLFLSHSDFGREENRRYCRLCFLVEIKVPLSFLILPYWVTKAGRTCRAKSWSLTFKYSSTWLKGFSLFSHKWKENRAYSCKREERDVGDDVIITFIEVKPRNVFRVPGPYAVRHGLSTEQNLPASRAPALPSCPQCMSFYWSFP